MRETNPGDLKVVFATWLDEMGKGLNLKGDPHYYENMQDMRRDALEGKLHFVAAPPMEIVETFREDEIGRGFVGARGKESNGLAIVVKKDAGVRSFADMAHRKMHILSDDRLSLMYSEIMCRRAFRKPCEQVLTVETEKRENQALLKVFFGQTDAALVSIYTLKTAEELNPQIAQRVMVIDSMQMPMKIPTFLLSRVDKDTQDRLLEAALSATFTERGKQMLTLFKESEIAKVNPEALLPARALLKEYQAGVQGKAASPKTR